MNGPVATGLGLVKVAGSFTSFQRCSGTIGVFEMYANTGVLGALKLNTSVVGFGAVTLVRPLFHRPEVSSAGYCLR